MEEIERWPKRPRPKTNKDNTFIKETSKEERKHHSSQTGKQRLRNHDYILLAPRRKEHTFYESETDFTLLQGI